jgi:hypothetical protein
MSLKVRRVQRKRILPLLVLGLQAEVPQFKRKEGKIIFTVGGIGLPMKKQYRRTG